MIKGNGVVACQGISIAKAFIYKKRELINKKVDFLGSEHESSRLYEAVEIAKSELTDLYDKACKEVGEENAFIFEVHKMLLEDEDFIDLVKSHIASGIEAAEAVNLSGEEFCELLSSMDDEYMRERAADFRDISGRLKRILSGAEQQKYDFKEPIIIIADDLEPSETMSFDKSMIRGFILKNGSTNSHTAILARVMNVPSLVNTNIDLDSDIDGKEVILDANNNQYIIEPGAKELLEAKDSIENEKLIAKELETYIGKETITLDGKKINLYNNIGSLEDVKKVLEFDAEGVGLFRSEFLYLGREDYPSEEEQFAVYKEVAQLLGDKKCIIRTLDIGADKQAAYFNLPKEENPALGFRAIRICLENRQLFRTQLRAILRASYYGNISVMFPMIISKEEVLLCKEELNIAKRELRQESIPYKDIEVGIMIETPAAVFIAEELAKEVDFFSVGTNDLTQYTLAIDRQNSLLGNFYNPKHPAILMMLKAIASAALKQGIWVGICGELAADMEITQTLINYGFTEISVSPNLTLKMRKNIININSKA